jgi:exfoliative toxin A/B
LRCGDDDDVGVKQFLTKIPVPICGLSLGLASLDRFLWYNHSDIYAFNVFALFSFIIAILFTLRIIADRKGVIKDIENPAVFAVLPTYTMTLFLLTAFVKDHVGGMAGDVSLCIWLGAVIASYALMVLFVKRFFFGFSIEKVFPGWIVIFVGYVVASVTSPSFGMEDIGKILFWSGLIGYISLTPLLAYRTVIVRGIPEPLVPQTAIFTAPVNLCIVGCLTVYADPPQVLVYILTFLGVVTYAAVICYLPTMLNRKFYPSFAALTFPLVISAVSFFMLGGHYGISSNDVFIVLSSAAAVIAAAVVVYVLILYTIFLFRAGRPQK